MTHERTPAATVPDVRFVSVEKRFDNVVAIPCLDLAIERGSLFSLLGPSGCGKTTTLRLIAGFEQPSKGHIFIRDKDVTGIPAYKRNFGMVFQNFALFPHLSVAENVAFGLRMRRLPKAQIREKVKSVLDLVALANYADRYPRQLSGGQQQRVALARAVVFEPDVLLLDEPLSALDKMLREQMQVEIRQLQQRLGITTVFVTHDQEEALTISDQIAVMKAGRVQQVGTPRSIYERPVNAFVATFLGASNIVEATVRGREGGRAVIDFAGYTLQVPDLDRAVGTRLQFALRPEKIHLKPEGAITATVRECIFQGAQTSLSLDVNGLLINAVVHNSDVMSLDLAPGSQVGLQWDSANMVALQPGSQVGLQWDSANMVALQEAN